MKAIKAPLTPAEIDKHVGSRIRERRRALKISQEDLGAAVGVRFQQMQKYETGANRVSASRLFLIAEVLKCDLHYFWGGLPSIYALSTVRYDPVSAHNKSEAAMLEAFRACRPDLQACFLMLAQAAPKREA